MDRVRAEAPEKVGEGRGQRLEEAFLVASFCAATRGAPDLVVRSLPGAAEADPNCVGLRAGASLCSRSLPVARRTAVPRQSWAV